MVTVADWPKTITAYAHGDKDGMWDIGEKLGLTGEALSLFRHALCEIKCTMSVNADGTYKIIEVKG